MRQHNDSRVEERPLTITVFSQKPGHCNIQCKKANHGHGFCQNSPRKICQQFFANKTFIQFQIPQGSASSLNLLPPFSQFYIPFMRAKTFKSAHMKKSKFSEINFSTYIIKVHTYLRKFF